MAARGGVLSNTSSDSLLIILAVELRHMPNAYDHAILNQGFVNLQRVHSRDANFSSCEADPFTRPVRKQNRKQRLRIALIEPSLTAPCGACSTHLDNETRELFARERKPEDDHAKTYQLSQRVRGIAKSNLRAGAGLVTQASVATDRLTS